MSDKEDNTSVCTEECESETGSEMCDDFTMILGNLLTSEQGANIPDILLSLKKSIDTHNKILMKLVTSLQK